MYVHTHCSITGINAEIVEWSSWIDKSSLAISQHHQNWHDQVWKKHRRIPYIVAPTHPITCKSCVVTYIYIYMNNIYRCPDTTELWKPSLHIGGIVQWWLPRIRVGFLDRRQKQKCIIFSTNQFANTQSGSSIRIWNRIVFWWQITIFANWPNTCLSPLHVEQNNKSERTNSLIIIFVVGCNGLNIIMDAEHNVPPQRNVK